MHSVQIEEERLNEAIAKEVERNVRRRGEETGSRRIGSRAEEVGTWKSYINVDHMEKERWGPLLVDADWYAFSQSLYKGIEGEDWRELFDAYKEMSRAVGVKKPHEAQEAEALCKMKAAKDAGEEYYDPTREDNIRGRNETRKALWEESTSKIQLLPWTKP